MSNDSHPWVTPREVKLRWIMHSLVSRCRRRAESLSVAWAQSDMVSSIISKVKCQSPPVLVLSLPRSGSTWVGEILGSAKNACYLFEPINTTYHENGGKGTLFGPKIEAVPPLYSYAFSTADAAFAGVPKFSRMVVRYPLQFNPLLRPSRRVVIKEVNPLICGELVERYNPRVIFLIRHPMAVLLSHERLGWIEGSLESWLVLNAKYAQTLAYALIILKSYDNVRFVCYEDLCIDPIGEFRKLYDFAELTWNDGVERLIEQRTRLGSTMDPFSTTRVSFEMKDKWRSQVQLDRIEIIRREYQSYNLPWYNLDEDW